MSQYFGKTISLISVTDNRYVGLLENIDSDKGTVTLNNVRCFGTEGRKNWGPEEIYPSPTVYKTVQFNGNDVKDLSILEVGLDEVQPVLRPQNVAAAPSQQQQDVPPQQQAHSQPDVQQTPANLPKENLPAAVADYGVYAPTEGSTNVGVSSEAAAEAVNQVERENTSHQNRAHHNNNRRQKQDPSRKIEIPKDDFDFTSNNAKFAKEAPESHVMDEIEEVEKANGEEHPEGFYNKKSSFFDSISTSAETNTNMRWQEEKALNMDTFGESSARPRFNNRRGNFRGRGRGRGSGRGRGRGGNRGNYNNNYNRNNNSDNFHSNFSSTNQVEF